MTETDEGKDLPDTQINRQCGELGSSRAVAHADIVTVAESMEGVDIPKLT
ncbi:hypothetical protein [Hornefia butyriciproducens]|nr:hypothetical protein [Hornefia butyriciproducens]MDD7019137.1 hypothetical protein [Hornefia butyriciproducens]